MKLPISLSALLRAPAAPRWCARAATSWFVTVLAGLAVSAVPLARAATAPRPNILFILTDDLGYGDVGAFFQNLRRAAARRSEPWHLTPHLDAFAAQGIQLRSHYCGAPVCAPSRATLLSGVTQGHAEVRNNQFDKALAHNHTLASVLEGAGYATAAFGKWGLQGKSRTGPTGWPGHPLKRGFGYYFGYIRHVDGHFHYPKEDGREVYENYTNVAAGLRLCYTTDLFTARAKKWIVDHTRNHPAQPFFIYLAYDTPHAKLENPPCPYPAGGGLHGGVQWLGHHGHMINTARGQKDSYVHPDYRTATWDHDGNPSTPEVPWPDVDRRYATDVRRIDNAVGDLLQLLADLHLDRKTLVVFSSDNGPSRESYLKGKDANGFSYAYRPDFFNSFGPFDGIKRDCWEGGMRMPTMARWPGTIPAGTVSNEPNGSWDWLPTFATLAGVPPPARTDGVSLVPTLTGKGDQKPSTIYIEYYHNGRTPNYPEFLPAHRGRRRRQMQAIRFGNYLGLRYNIHSAQDPFEIYDVTSDPQESHNLASTPGFARLQQEMQAAVLQVRMPNASAPRPYDRTPVPSVTASDLTPGLRWRAYSGSWPWLPKFDDLTPVASGTGTRPTLRPVIGGQADGLLFSGLLRAPETGAYTFYLTTDGPCFLRLHQCQVIDGDFGHRVGSTVSGTIRLQAGLHPFRLYYARAAGQARKPELQFEWSGPGLSRQPVLATQFTRATGMAAR